MSWKWLAMIVAAPCLATTAVTAVRAQPAPAAATAAGQPGGHVVRLILLGTGAGPMPRAQRSQPASLLVVDGRPYLIDAGDGTSQQIVRAGFRPSQIRTIFITHHHIDHNAGLEPLMSFIWIGDNLARQPNAPAIQIVGPPDTSLIVKAALDFASVSERIFSSQIPMLPASGLFKVKDIAGDGVVFQDDRIRVTAMENSHFHIPPGSPAFGRDKAFSYRFDTPAGSFVFTGDTGPSDAVVKLAKGADVLISEVANADLELAEVAQAGNLPPKAADGFRFHLYQEHLAPEEVGKIAQTAGVKVVVLNHFSPGADGQNDTTPYTEGVARHFAGTVIPGRDLFEYDLSTGTAP